MNTLRTLQLLLIAAGTVTALAVQAQGIKVNGITIPQSKIDFLLKNAIAQGQADTPELRNQIREELINRELLSQEAAKKGLDKNAEVAMQIDMQRQGVLINAYLQDYMRTHPITDEAIRKEYDQAKAQAGDKEYRARHILVEKEDEAKDIIAQLKRGGNFEKIAADRSKDQGSKASGGDLGWASPRRYVPAFGQALTKLKKGQTTETPVQTQFGWHVIHLDDERAMKIPSFDEAKPQLQQMMRNQMVQKAVSDLRAKAKIE